MLCQNTNKNETHYQAMLCTSAHGTDRLNKCTDLFFVLLYHTLSAVFRLWCMASTLLCNCANLNASFAGISREQKAIYNSVGTLYFPPNI